MALLSACTSSAGSNESQAAPTIAYPALGQNYATTDRDLSAYKWSNADNTQEPNSYEFANSAGESMMLHVAYAATPDGDKRVSDIHYYNGIDSAAWAAAKLSALPRDTRKVSLASIGGNLRDIFAAPDSGEVTTFYRSASLASSERKWRVPACEAASSMLGVVIVTTKSGNGTAPKDAYITDAAVHYCGKLL